MAVIGIDIQREAIADFCRRWGIGEFSLFGSVLRGDFNASSDIDVLFRMLPGRSYGFLEYFDMKDELERLFARPVDFVEREVVEESRNWIRRKSILSTAETVYAA